MTEAAIAVANPATGEVVAYVADRRPAEVAELARRGRAAQPGWQALGFDGRAEILRTSKLLFGALRLIYSRGR